MDFLFSFPVVVVFAIAGAVVVSAATILQARKTIGAERARLLNRAGYTLTGISVLLFIIAGFRG